MRDEIDALEKSVMIEVIRVRSAKKKAPVPRGSLLLRENDQAAFTVSATSLYSGIWSKFMYR